MKLIRIHPADNVAVALTDLAAGEHLTADDLLAGEVVAVDYDVVQGRRLAFGNTHFHIDGVLGDRHLYGSDVEEQVTVVTVKLRHVIVILLAAAHKALLHGHDVIWVTLLHGKDLVEGIGGID